MKNFYFTSNTNNNDCNSNYKVKFVKVRRNSIIIFYFN